MAMAGLTDLHLSFIHCRTYGHSWDEFTPLTRPNRVFSWQTHLRCTRCTTERHDSYDTLGEVVQREYKYVEGYALAEKLTRAQFRLELRRRARSKSGIPGISPRARARKVGSK
jgi:hypothetical protein